MFSVIQRGAEQASRFVFSLSTVQLFMMRNGLCNNNAVTLFCWKGVRTHLKKMCWCFRDVDVFIQRLIKNNNLQMTKVSCSPKANQSFKSSSRKCFKKQYFATNYLELYSKHPKQALCLCCTALPKYCLNPSIWSLPESYTSADQSCRHCPPG